MFLIISTLTLLASTALAFSHQKRFEVASDVLFIVSCIAMAVGVIGYIIV